MKVTIPYEVLNEEMHPKRGVFYLPFVIDHFDQLDTTQPELLAVARGYDLRSMISSQAMLGAAVTAFYRNKPIAIFGVVLFWGGVGEMWSIFDNQAREHPASMLRCGRSFVDIATRYLNLHRLQITVRTDDIRAIRYAKALLFETEAILKMYGPDKVDYLLMTRY